MADGSQLEPVQFMRRPGAEMVELRGDCPRAIVNVLDAFSLARDMTRTQLVNEILGDWAAKRRHELQMLTKLDSGVTPAGADGAGAGR